MTSRVLELPVAFADARAADLRLHLGLPPQPALASRAVDGNGWTAELRILGASHQVLVEQGERVVWSETVACHLPDAGARLVPLPGRHRIGSDYEFRSRVVRLEPADFRSMVEDLLRHHAGKDEGEGPGLCACFPGDELGATALRLDPHDGRQGPWLRWRTWHTYPRTGEVVTTSSRAALTAGSSAGRT
jgi:hypothetical protein